jgi:DNA-binding NarL/FixJ family response regulator
MIGLALALTARRRGELRALLEAHGFRVVTDEDGTLRVSDDPALPRVPMAAGEADDGIGAEVEELTPREREVLDLVSRGFSNRRIAGQLGISVHTVKFHVSTIYGKLGATNRAEAVSLAVRRGLIAV